MPLDFSDPEVATALAEAEARGRRQGLEEAAKVIGIRLEENVRAYGQQSTRADECWWVERHIRSLATAPAETQKPEETA